MRAWYFKINEHFVKEGFKRIHYNSDLYVKNCNGDFIIVVLCVDELITIGSSVSHAYNYKRCLEKVFDIMDFGFLYYFLRIHI